ncbi:MAG: hypothetical protein LBQ37_00460 [Elusimicrobiota bacterium]|jgi:predicted Fe-Mo cluster-binding NifX family protein|nr:hypothetical protein [Elusimicrobiota bacterium]
MKIAISSSDGNFVDIHFGKCLKWTIADFDPQTGNFSILQTREAQRLCSGGGHNENAVETIFETLSDCGIIITARMGIWIKQSAINRGIKVIEYVGEIKDCLEILRKS